MLKHKRTPRFPQVPLKVVKQLMVLRNSEVKPETKVTVEKVERKNAMPYSVRVEPDLHREL